MDNIRGKVLAGGLIGLVTWLRIGEEPKRKVLGTLDHIGGSVIESILRANQRELALQAAERSRQAELARQTAVRQRQVELERQQVAIQRILQTAVQEGALPTVKPSATSPGITPKQGLPMETDSRWRGLIEHPSVVLVLGKRGSGKSALGYRLLELSRYIAKKY